MALISIASLIFFFHHAARAIQASVVIDRAANDTFDLIGSSIQESDSHDDFINDAVALESVADIRSEISGYVTEVDTNALVRLASEHQIVIWVNFHIGDHLFTGMKIASLSADPDDEDTSQHVIDHHEEIANGIRRSILTGMERTMKGDVLFGYRQLADIAVKALSPGINDPTTAIICIDRLGEALMRSRGLRDGSVVRKDAEDQPRLVMPQVGFRTFLVTGVQQIRHFGAGDATVMAHLLHMLGIVADGADPGIRFQIEPEAHAALEEAMLAIEIPIDRARALRCGMVGPAIGTRMAETGRASVPRSAVVESSPL